MRGSELGTETFLKIERPAGVADGQIRTITRPPNENAIEAARVHQDSEEHFYSIGEFYQAVQTGLRFLHAQMGNKLFSAIPPSRSGRNTTLPMVAD